MNQKLNNIKIIFSDIDGTMCNSEKQVTEYTKNIINRINAKGINIVLCSGRTNLDMRELSKMINASKYVISCNGAFVYNYQDDVDIYKSAMKKESIENIWKFCKKENIELILESKKVRYTNFKNHKKKYIEINDIEDISEESIFQVVMNNVETEKRKEIEKFLLRNEEIWSANHGINKSNKYYYDVNNKNIDKGIGIQQLINSLGIKKEETIGFGDGVNDYAMFRECGISVAMENAEKELKNVANYITLTNNEDGVAKFIEKYILEE